MRQLLRRQPHGQVRGVKRRGPAPTPPPRPRGDLRTCISRDKHDHATRQTKPPCAGFRGHASRVTTTIAPCGRQGRPARGFAITGRLSMLGCNFFRICESVSFCSQSPPGVLAFARTARPTQAGKILAYPEKIAAGRGHRRFDAKPPGMQALALAPSGELFHLKAASPFPLRTLAV